MLNKILEKLRNFNSTNTVENQCKNEHLLDNLEIYLNYLLEIRSRALVIGEAPGHLGCTKTGIPFTSPFVIRKSKNPLFKSNRNMFFIDGVTKENTANYVWGYFESFEEVPIFWNAFPFHPHGIDDICSNRKPNSAEMENGKKFIKLLVRVFKPKLFIGVGRVAEKVLNELYPEKNIHYVTHPARGNKYKFLSEISEYF